MKPDPTITRIVIGDKFSEEGVELVQASKNLTGKSFPMNVVQISWFLLCRAFQGPPSMMSVMSVRIHQSKAMKNPATKKADRQNEEISGTGVKNVARDFMEQHSLKSTTKKCTEMRPSKVS